MRSLIGARFLFIVFCGFAASLGLGLAAGLVNGLIIAQLRVPPFIATLGMLGIAEGIAYVLSGGPPVSIGAPGLGALGNGSVFYWHPDAGFSMFGLPGGVAGVELRRVISVLPYQVLYWAALTIVCAWLLASTRFGRHVYAIGGNAKAALRARHTRSTGTLSESMCSRQ